MPAYSFASKSVYLLDAVRTAVGSPFKSLKDFSVGELGGFVLGALVKRSGFAPEDLGEVIWGNTVLAGAGQNPARQAAILGGLPPETPAYTVSNVCGAGLQAIFLAGQSLALGVSDGIIAGGSESATRTPQMFSKSVETPFEERDPVDSLLYDGLWCNLTGQHMGQLAEELAKKEKISRIAQDQFALESHRKAAAGQFADEIIAVMLADQKVFAADERIRRRLNLENFATLPGAFAENGTITSGNSSVPSDGAAAVLLGNENFIKSHKLKPLARIVGAASIALEPALTFTAAVSAVEACLKVCGLKMKDIDLFEICEAFAAQAIYTRDRLKIPSEKMNIYGGDLALGHPLGAAGSRIVVTLTHALKRHNKKYGLAAICYGGGGAMAMIIERVI
jgi:acetyl-CoA C-acetyltransferase